MSIPTKDAVAGSGSRFDARGGDLELLKEIAVLFLENYQAWLGELREAGWRGDAKRWSGPPTD